MEPTRKHVCARQRLNELDIYSITCSIFCRGLSIFPLHKEKVFRCLTAPIFSWRHLPGVPKRIVGAAYESLQPSIGILYYKRTSGKDYRVGWHTKRIPTSPDASRRYLPDMPECTVGADVESLKTPILILPYKGSRLNVRRGGVIQ